MSHPVHHSSRDEVIAGSKSETFDFNPGVAARVPFTAWFSNKWYIAGLGQETGDYGEENFER